MTKNFRSLSHPQKISNSNETVEVFDFSIRPQLNLPLLKIQAIRVLK